uniref:Thrombopoietin n=1 Tax=Hucho hucho TaxID=62062 RepID=A0A4W5RG77_9TELE
MGCSDYNDGVIERLKMGINQQVNIVCLDIFIRAGLEQFGLTDWEADCDALKTLPFPIQLPCIKVHKASWERKSAHEKKGDIAASLGALSRSVLVVKTLSQPGCAAILLERLEHTVNNYLLIITHLDIRGSVESPLFSCTPQSTHSLSTVLWTFSRLITGKLEWLMTDLTHGCP